MIKNKRLYSFQHFSDHIIKDSSVFVISKVHFRVKSQLRFERTAIVQLQKYIFRLGLSYNSLAILHTITLRTSTVISCSGLTSVGILMVYFSLPVSRRVSAFCPSRNCSGMMPIPTRFDLWILSYDSAIMALIPC